jgi:hypothetical protein
MNYRFQYKLAMNARHQLPSRADAFVSIATEDLPAQNS